jgi:hypothetical protein
VGRCSSDQEASHHRLLRRYESPENAIAYFLSEWAWQSQGTSKQAIASFPLTHRHGYTSEDAAFRVAFNKTTSEVLMTSEVVLSLCT